MTSSGTCTSPSVKNVPWCSWCGTSMKLRRRCSCSASLKTVPIKTASDFLELENGIRSQNPAGRSRGESLGVCCAVRRWERGWCSSGTARWLFRQVVMEAAGKSGLISEINCRQKSFFGLDVWFTLCRAVEMLLHLHFSPL